MKTISREVARLLRCPRCRASLAIEEGETACANGHRYRIVRGVPCLFEEARLDHGKRRTVEAFGYSWTHYPKSNPYTEEQWRDWILPLTSADFDGKLVLDAGCGLGGFSEYAIGWGARQVVGVDLSEAVHAARERLNGSVDFVQADIYGLPFAPGSFDLAYAIGVLHHLPEPEQGFRAVASLVRPGGRVFAWVYGRENNGWIVHVIDPLRKHLFSRLPQGLVKWGLSLPLALALMPVVKVAGLFRRLPYGEYLRWLGRRDFQFVHGVVFDHLVAPTSHYIRREEFEGWFERAGLVDVEISWRNRNSWRGVGRVPRS